MQACLLATVRHKYKVALQLPVLVSLKDDAKHKAKENQLILRSDVTIPVYIVQAQIKEPNQNKTCIR